MLTRIANVIGEITSYLYYVVGLIVVSDVIFRFVFSRPFGWTIEVCVLLCGIQFLLSGITTTANDDHIRIDSLHRLLPEKTRRRAALIAPAASLLFLWAVTYSGGLQALTAIRAFERTGSLLNSPMPVILKTLIPIAAFSMSLIILVRWARSLAGARRGKTN